MGIVSPKSWKPPKLGKRVSLKPLSFRRMIWQDGSVCLWEKSIPCPCSSTTSLKAGDELSRTGNPRQACECKGKGFLYHSPQEIQANVVDASKNPEFYQIYGDHAKGMARITFQPEHLVRAWDRITVLESVMPMNDPDVLYVDGEKIRLRYPIASVTLELGSDADETVLELQESNGTYIRVAGPDGVLLPDPLLEGVGFQVDGDGQIEILADIDDRSVLSIDYWCHPAYIAQNTPHVHRDTRIPKKNSDGRLWRRFPTQVHAWLEHYGPPHGYQAT